MDYVTRLAGRPMGFNAADNPLLLARAFVEEHRYFCFFSSSFFFACSNALVQIEPHVHRHDGPGDHHC